MLHLSVSRAQLAGAAIADDIALFAGGINSNGACDTIDIVQYIDNSNCKSY